MSSLLNLAGNIQSAIRSNTDIELTSGHSIIEKELIDVMLDFPETPDDFDVNVKKGELYKKVILVSGGADSTIMWELNKHEESKLGLYVDLGHSYTDKEIDTIKNMDIPAKYIKYDMKFDSFWNHIIPTRNFTLIALAEQFVAHEGEIWLGAVQGESSPDSGDKSELFFRMVENYIWRTHRKKVYIKTLKSRTKNDWLKWYLESTGDMRILQTITCFDGTTEKPCGKCQACVRKWISLKYCDMPTDGFFEIDPYIGGKEYIEKYKLKMQEALDNEDFEHYSKDRCLQDLKIILEYEALISV